VLDSLWSRFLEVAAQKLPPAVIDSWLRPCRLLTVEGDHLVIGAPNRFSRDWLVQHHLEALQSVAQECLGGHPHLSISVSDDPSPRSPSREPSPTGARREVSGTPDGLNPRYTFDAFVVGSSNTFAQSAC